MEYLPGLSLEQLVERHGPLPAARVVHILSQLCGALSEAHARGLVHRDSKPPNVIVGERGGMHDVAKLLDFGLVSAFKAGATDERLTQAGVVVGTPAFMSPEQCGGEELGPASDIYSLGALGYYLLTGKPVFAGRTPVQMLAAHMYEAPQPMATHGVSVPAELEAVVLRCLAKRPAGRFDDVEQLEDALERCGRPAPWSERDARHWWLEHGPAAPAGEHGRAREPDEPRGGGMSPAARAAVVASPPAVQIRPSLSCAMRPRTPPCRR